MTELEIPMMAESLVWKTIIAKLGGSEMSRTLPLSLTHPQLRDNRTSGSSSPEKGWNGYTVVFVNKHRKKTPNQTNKKPQPEERGVSDGQGVPWDISWHLLAPHRAGIMPCAHPSNQEKWHIWPLGPKGTSWRHIGITSCDCSKGCIYPLVSAINKWDVFQREGC